ncbi:MAG: hypothetical protein JW833_00475 [Prolixibacteraceae bacterium]|nr:hypothetical protein [Prolixibacteraceae bacterium]
MKQKEIIALTPQTGGVLKANQVIGREKLIEDYWRILKRQGIVLYAERRFGKSSVLIKMNASVKDGFLTIYKGVEGAENADDFVNILFERIKEKKIIEESRMKEVENVFNTITSHIKKVAGIELNKVDKKWEKQLYYIIKLLTEQYNGKYIIIMLDEFSIMLSKMENSEAVNVLGFLRDLVQNEFPEQLRFVYCGSIGIDLVIDKIKRAGYNIGDPINHLNKQRLLPFSKNEALYFSRCLSQGCGLKISKATMEYICKEADNIPYFIDVIFDKIKDLNSIKKAQVDMALDSILNDSTNSNSLKHFYDRIEKFYPDKVLVNHILNFISGREGFISENEIASHVEKQVEIERMVLNEEIDRLWRDGYFERELIDGKRHFRFNYSIVKKWWAINKAV